MSLSGALVTGSLLTVSEERFDPLAEQILVAARAQFIEFGMRRTSLDDIAKAAGISRATLFRRFPNRDALMFALAVREARAGIAAVDEQVAAIDDPEELLVATTLSGIQALLDNDLLRRLLATDPDQMLPQLTVQSTPILTIGREYIAGQLRRLQETGAEVSGDLEVIAEMLARFVLSLAGNRESTLPLDDNQELERVVRTTLVPMILGRSGRDLRKR
jgi:TetR/AcrR family transcriptional repressor of uid operon